jgi:hypothetical protein
VKKSCVQAGHLNQWMSVSISGGSDVRRSLWYVFPWDSSDRMESSSVPGCSRSSYPIWWSTQPVILQLVGKALLAGGVVSMWVALVPVDG